MNPVLDNVPGAFERIATRGTTVAIDRKDVVLPTGGHFQGIQRLSDRRLVITSSSQSEAYLVICDLDAGETRGRANPPVRLGRSPMDHAGGCQAVGNYLVVGVEDDAWRRNSEIQFWNLSSQPVLLTALTIPRSGAEKVSTAGAVGISSYRSGAALSVATWDADTIDFYVNAADPFHMTRSRFDFRATWWKSGADKAAWIDAGFGSYQCTNLVSQRDGKLYLIGFHRNGTDDWMDLFSVDLDAPHPKILRKVASKRMFTSDGCSFSQGAGVYVASETRIEVYAVNGDSQAAVIQVNHFGSA